MMKARKLLAHPIQHGRICEETKAKSIGDPE